MLTHVQSHTQNPIYLSTGVSTQELGAIEALPMTASKPKVAPNLSLPPKKLRLSATQLETFAVCPSQYLVRHRLKLRPLQPLEEKYALIFGSAVHAALESYFHEPSMALEDLFHRSLRSQNSEIESHPALLTMMKEQFQRTCDTFKELEQVLKNQFGFERNIGLEKEFELKIDPFTFVGKIDRIIERTNHSQLLIDYKTGAVDFTPNQILKGEHYQALLYLLSLKQQSQLKCLGVLFYDLKNGELRRGIFDDSETTKELKAALTRGHVLSQDKWNDLIEQGKFRMLELSKQIESGHFPAKPHATECARCEAPTFCRQGVGYV
jgi:ATP-dependent helicase/DNAse subunit B